MSFFYGLLLCILGGAIMYYSRSLEENFGRSAWAEKHLGTTATMYVLIGFGMIVVGVLMRFGLSSDLSEATNTGFGK